MKFFKDVKTFEELKRQYKKLAFLHHPDKGGKVEDMQTINNEYDELFKTVKNVHESADGKTYTRANTTETPDKFRDIINAIININAKIEICGAWIWVFGGYNDRETLKKNGFFYCSGKKAWAWTDKPSENKYHLSIDEIRRLHGSEIVKDKTESNLLKAI